MTAHRWLAIGVLAAVAAAGCSGDDDSAAAPTTRAAVETTTTPTTAAPSTTAAPPTTSAADAIAAGQCPALPADAAPDLDRPQYSVTATIDAVAGTVAGAFSVSFVPDLPTDRLVFRLWPNAPRTASVGVELTMGPVTEGATTRPTTQPNPTTVDVALGRTLAAGESVTVGAPFSLVVPETAHDRVSHDGTTLRLGGFLPVLAWEPGYGWSEDPATSLFGESASTPTADFDMDLTVVGDGVLLASGERGADGVWHATAVRDVAVSVGDYNVATAVANAPDPVAVSIGVERAAPEDPSLYMDRVVESLQDYGTRFGAYPWSTFSLVITNDLEGNGIEYPTFVMQGTDTFGRTTPHEVGHQWFYSLVGNDQGRDPWLDESLASYAEFTHDGTLEQDRQIDIPAEVEGHTGEPMTYWESRGSVYYRGVYVQGAVAVASLGEPWLVDCALRHYVASNRFRIARPDDLYASFETIFPDVRTQLAPYGLGT